MAIEHGKTRTFGAQIATLSVNANKEGMYTMRTEPIAEINPKGVFQFTHKQLTNMAAAYGFNDWKSLATVITAGGCTLRGVASYCKAGEEWDNGKGVYTKDWWKINNVGLVIELGEAAENLKNDLLREKALNLEVAADKKDRQKASALRMALLTGSNGTGDAEEDGVVIEDEDIPLEEEA